MGFGRRGDQENREMGGLLDSGVLLGPGYYNSGKVYRRWGKFIRVMFFLLSFRIPGLFGVDIRPFFCIQGSGKG